MSSDASQPIRSYQRIFRPQRRIYQIDGRRLPVPGGVPLEWVGWAFCTLVLILVLSQCSLPFAILAGAVMGVLGASAHGLPGGVIAFAAGVAVTLALGVLLDWLDWPLRFLICPGLVATLAGQASPDGRPAHRYLLCWLGVRLRAPRRSLERVLPADGMVKEWAPQVWIAPDQHSPVLQHGRVQGPAQLVFAKPVVVIPARKRFVVRPAEGHRIRPGERCAEVIELGDGQILEVRP